MSEHVILVGAGLANGLIAYRLRQSRPDLALTVIDSADAPGGNHTWSFHASDLSTEARSWIEPFVCFSWSSQTVRFPKYRRELATRYCTITSDRFAERIGAMLGTDLRLGVRAKRVEPTRVTLEDGSTIEGTAVIDGRGFPRKHGLALGWQKFYGIEIRTSTPHGLASPILMDADVPQLDGYRFIYSLPFSDDRILIEDTRYSDTPGLAPGDCHGLLEAYAARKGWAIAEILRSETGSLPIALDGDIRVLLDQHGDVPVAGMAAGLFHPTTGYSLPDAVRMAETVSALDTFEPTALARRLRGVSESAWDHRRFFRMLNRMLFRAARPDERYRVFERFYTLNLGLIERFYADRLTPFDMLRILSGKPPVPIHRAIPAILTTPRMPLEGKGAVKS